MSNNNSTLQSNNVLLQAILQTLQNKVVDNNGTPIKDIFSAELCSLTIKRSYKKIFCFQKDVNTNCISFNQIMSSDFIPNIPVGSIIFIEVYSSDDDIFFKNYDGILHNNLTYIDYAGFENNFISNSGQYGYGAYIINGNVYIDNKGSGVELWSHSLIQSGDTSKYSLTNIPDHYGSDLLSGLSYMTTIRPADDCGIDSVTVTMDGVDITSTVYDGFDKIYIDSVTGDVEITVTIVEPTNILQTAIIEPSSTEIYNGIGYIDGYRYSKSGASDVAHSNGRVTGWIPYTKGLSYVCKNFNPQSGYVDGLYIIYYKQDGTTEVKSTGLKTTGNYKVDIINNEIELLLQSDDYTYFKISGYSGNDDPVVYSMCPIKVTSRDYSTESRARFSFSNPISRVLYGSPYKTKISTNFKILHSDDDVNDSVAPWPEKDEGHFEIYMNDEYIGNSVFDHTTGELLIPEVTGPIKIVIESNMYNN